MSVWFATPKEAASYLGICTESMRSRIRRGVIKNVVTNGCKDNGTRYLINMTREFGVTKEEANVS